MDHFLLKKKIIMAEGLTLNPQQKCLGNISFNTSVDY